jgi:flavorubredoxin
LEHVSRDHVNAVRRWREAHDRLLALVEELTTALLQELREPKK